MGIKFFFEYEAQQEKITSDECLSVTRLEVVEPRSVDDSRDDVSHVERLLQIHSNYAVDLVCWVQRLVS